MTMINPRSLRVKLLVAVIIVQTLLLAVFVNHHLNFTESLLAGLPASATPEFISAAKNQVLWDGITLATAEVLFVALLVLIFGNRLVRRMERIIKAGAAMSAGDYSVRVPVDSRDVVGRMAESFNGMAQVVEDRVQQLHDSGAKFHAIADYTYDWEMWIGPDGKLTWVNPSVRRITGYTPEECLAMKDFLATTVYAGDLQRVSEEFRRALEGNHGYSMDFRIIRKDGEMVWASAHWRAIYGEKNEYLGIRSSIRDISRRKQGEMALHSAVAELEKSRDMQQTYLAQSRQEHARLFALLSAMNIGILFVGPDNKVKYSNPAFQQIWIIPAETPLVDMDADKVLRHSANVLARPDHFSKHLLKVVGTHKVSETIEIQMVDGRIITQLSYPVREETGTLVGFMWIYEDITRERQTADQLIYLAERDALTGLYNRHRFQEELTRMLAESERHGSRMALLFFDLDEFKHINDTFGHRAGDAMLIRVAGEVGTQIRRHEIFSRIGGDEFAILVPDVTTNDEIQALAERIVRAIARIPFQFEGHNLRLTSSLGIAIFPDHATNSNDLVTQADTAMYQAKDAGKNTWRVYRHEQDTTKRIISRLNWNERTQHALENGLMRLHFQGIYNTQTRELMHLEALVRMIDEKNPGQIIMPSNFIPVVEKTGKILDVDRWVIRKSIKTLALSDDIPPIAVNISGRSFNEPTLPQYITEQLREFKVNPKRLIVELTETSAVTDLHDAQRFIEALHLSGCSVCLDDFGTGFSSFAYLKHLNADILKIDGLFIRDLPNDRDNQVFVKAILDVARGMRKITVAEFVEDEGTLEMLKTFGVDMVQGYQLDVPSEFHPAVAEHLEKPVNNVISLGSSHV